VRAWANLYPWDVVGDPAAADRIARLGLTGVTLAAAYHSVRAVAPFHPRHRIVTRDAAVYYRADPANGGPPTRPARGCDPRWPGGRVVQRGRRRTASRGREVTAWAVSHNSRLGAVVPSARCATFGDGYPWALCLLARGPDSPPRWPVKAAALRVAWVRLEACGGTASGTPRAHDKTVERGRAGPAAQWLLSLCFFVRAAGVRGGGCHLAWLAPPARLHAAGTAAPAGPPRHAGTSARDSCGSGAAGRRRQGARRDRAASRPVPAPGDAAARVAGRQTGLPAVHPARATGERAAAPPRGRGDQDRAVLLGSAVPCRPCQPGRRDGAAGHRRRRITLAVVEPRRRPATLRHGPPRPRHPGATELRLYHARLAGARPRGYRLPLDQRWRRELLRGQVRTSAR
jgi:hypothetical protein